MSTPNSRSLTDRAAEVAAEATRSAKEAVSETVSLVHVEYQKYLDKRNAIRRETARLRRSAMGLQLS